MSSDARVARPMACENPGRKDSFGKLVCHPYPRDQDLCCHNCDGAGTTWRITGEQAIPLHHLGVPFESLIAKWTFLDDDKICGLADAIRDAIEAGPR